MSVGANQIETCARAMQAFDAALASDRRPWSELHPRDQSYWRQRARVGLEAVDKEFGP